VSITEFHDTKEVVTSIKASDADDPTSPNGQVRFDIRGGSGADMFILKQIDPWNANIFARTKLNKKYGNYSLDIVVKDLGSPQMSIDLRLDICVQDFNDHAPYFVSPINNYTIRVAEVSEIGAGRGV
jgi:cadherin 23